MTSEIQEKGQRAKAASYMLNIKTTCEKNEALKKNCRTAINRST